MPRCTEGNVIAVDFSSRHAIGTGRGVCVLIGLEREYESLCALRENRSAVRLKKIETLLALGHARNREKA